MSDYIFMLDSHLSSEQSKVVTAVKDAASTAGINVFLTGGAMRDMLGGFPIRDLDFTVEGEAVRFAKSLAAAHKAEIVHSDDLRKSVELRFPSGVTSEIAMARQERYAKPGGKPSVQQATIHEDLRGRDFTVNSIGLSLSKASNGLLLDPTNGLADLERRELHAVSNFALYDDPSRILRMFRLKIRLGYQISERTLTQYRNVREAGLEAKITTTALGRELHLIASETAAAEMLQALDQEGLLTVFAPGLTGAKLNVAAFQKLQKARQLIPADGGVAIDELSLFLNLLVERLTPKERGQLLAATGLEKAVLDHAQRYEAHGKKLEKLLSSPKLQRPSALYGALSKVPGEDILYLLIRSNQRLVVDRVRNYLQKYLPAAHEVTEAMIIEHGGTPGTAKYARVKQELIASRLDSRPRKPAPVEAPPEPPPVAAPPRRQSTWGR